MDSVSPRPPSGAAVQLPAFDALRAMAALAIVYGHSTMSFFLPAWVGVQDVSADRLARTMLHESLELLHCFVLSVFFLVAGFFARSSCLRRGAAGMFRDRLRRVFLPLLIAMVTVVPLIQIMQQIGHARACHPAGIPWVELGRFVACGAPWHIRGPHYLWFLDFLMLYYALAAIAGRNVAAIDPTRFTPTRVDRMVAFVCRSPWGPLILTIPTLALIAAVRGPIIAEVGRNFLAQPPLVAMYGLYFGFGWRLQRVEYCLPELARAWKTHSAGGLLVWAIGTATLLSWHGEQTDFRLPHPATESGGAPMSDEPPADRPMSPVFPVYPLMKAYLSWAMTLGAVGLALAVCTRPHPAVHHLADASYWIYLVHGPLLMAVQVLVADWRLPWWIKLPAINLFVVGTLLLVYRYVLRPAGLLVRHRHAKR